MGNEALEQLADAFRNENADEPARLAALGRLLAAYDPVSPLPPDARRHAGGLVAALLSPLAKREAERAAAHLPLHQREEFVADALIHVFASRNQQGKPRICAFSVAGATHGRLVCWLRQVMLRLLQSARRATRRRPKPVAMPADQASAAPGPAEVAEARDPAWAAPLRQGDLAALAEVPAKLRVRLVAVTGAWLRVPAETWEAWLSDYESACDVSLVRPCPPAALLRSDNANQFVVGLASALKTTAGTLNGVRYQQIPRFRQVLEYLGGTDDPSGAGLRTDGARLPGA